MLLCYLSVVAWPAISRHFTRCSHSNWGSRLFPFHGGFQGGRGLVSAAPAEPPNSYLPVEVNKPKQLSSFYKMFHLLLREQKAKCAGTSKTELWGLLGVPPVIWRKSSSKDTSYPAKPPAENELRS